MIKASINRLLYLIHYRNYYTFADVQDIHTCQDNIFAVFLTICLASFSTSQPLLLIFMPLSFSIVLILCFLGCPAGALLSRPLLRYLTWNFMFPHFRHPDSTFLSPCRWLFMYARTYERAHFRCAPSLLPDYMVAGE